METIHTNQIPYLFEVNLRQYTFILILVYWYGNTMDTKD